MERLSTDSEGITQEELQRFRKYNESTEPENRFDLKDLTDASKSVHFVCEKNQSNRHDKKPDQH